MRYEPPIGSRRSFRAPTAQLRDACTAERAGMPRCGWSACGLHTATVVILGTICWLAAGHSCSTAAEADPELPIIVADLISETCSECHAGEQPAGDLHLQQLSWELGSTAVRQQWVQVHDRIARGEMPPEGDRLPADDRAKVLDVLADALHRADHREVRKQGRGSMRRLNRREYEQNLRDLLKLPQLDIRDRLPPDRVAHDSDKAAATLDITRVQLAAYLDAAEVALRQAVAPDVRPRVARRYHALATDMFPKAVDHAGRESSFYAKFGKMVPLTQRDLSKIREHRNHDEHMEIALFRSATWPYYGYPERFVAEQAGAYRVRFWARSVRQVKDFRLIQAPDPQPMTFRARKRSKADVSGDVRATGGIVDVQPEGKIYETIVHLKPAETIEYSLLGLPVPFPITSHGGPLYYDFPPMPEGGHPGIAFRWIEITGPIESRQWPPPSHQVLFGDLPIRASHQPNRRLAIELVSKHPQQDATRLLRRFAAQAAGRPIPAALLAPYEQVVHQQLDQEAGLAEALLAGYQALLCSSHFLFLQEPKDPGDHVAIAARLSHLLWNSRPDAQLHGLAKQHRLRDAAVLRSETERLIADPRFDRFVENFTDYWLDLRQIQRDSPDIRLYPEYRGDDYLIESMERETRAFFKTVVQENLPARVLIDADFALVNDRLARHYELPQVRGSILQKVTLPPGSPRGGLLTQAAVLKVTANGTTTSPVTRGAWIMDRILGEPPPPPPPGAAAIEPDLRGATTIRQLLARHAADPSCAACHARFDPVGLALENFDVAGAWRDRYRSLERGDEVTGIDRAGHKFSYRVASAVDPAGRFPDGAAFHDIHELKTILAARSRQLARNLLRRWTVYATGTPVRFSDRREIETILNVCAPSGYRLQELLLELVKNRIFLGEAGLANSRGQTGNP